MKLLRLRYAFGNRIAGAMLAGSLLAACSGGLQETRLTPASSQGAYGRSWMVSYSGKQNLLYVSDLYTSQVYVYSYPGRKLEGTLSGFSGPAGLCIDKAGDVFVANRGGNDILEYAHGGTQPIATIDDAGYIPVDCSVDVSTGDLAVTNFCQVSGDQCIGPGNVDIYKNASGTPVTITDASITLFYYCGYDSRGNLFADGDTDESGAGFQLAELRNGQTKLDNISLNRVVYYPAGVLWDGKYVAVGDGDAGGKFASSIHQVAVKGMHGTIVSTTRLAQASEIDQFWLQGSKLIAPDFQVGRSSNVLLYSYPKGGKPTAVITGSFESPVGATVSLAR
jgi:hypothetical protein